MVQFLLKAIHSFYPVGINSLMGKYEGFSVFRRILDRKINEIAEGHTSSWTMLKDEIKCIFPHQSIIEQSYNQFPSYQLYIRIFERDEKGIRFERRLCLNISLLCQYYTLFFETIVSIKSHNDSEHSVATSRIFSFFDLEESKKNDIDEIKLLIEKNYKDYQFVHHKILFSYFIEGCGTYSNWQEYETGQKNPIYLFLFDSHLMLENTIITE